MDFSDEPDAVGIIQWGMAIKWTAQHCFFVHGLESQAPWIN
jgi:hypothetical protein